MRFSSLSKNDLPRKQGKAKKVCYVFCSFLHAHACELMVTLMILLFSCCIEIKGSKTIPLPEVSEDSHITLTSHPDSFGVDPVPISWGHPDPQVRGPVICTVRHAAQRNAIGAHSGSYCIYTGLAVAAKKLNPDYVPNLKLTSPVMKIGPYPSWTDPKKVH